MGLTAVVIASCGTAGGTPTAPATEPCVVAGAASGLEPRGLGPSGPALIEVDGKPVFAAVPRTPRLVGANPILGPLDAEPNPVLAEGRTRPGLADPSAPRVQQNYQ